MYIKKPGNFEGFANFRERNPLRGSGDSGNCLGLARDCQDASFQHLTRAALCCCDRRCICFEFRWLQPERNPSQRREVETLHSS
ncbi:hypothetical protein GFS60_01775 [Rhodococcus sp. WAY2]|nr:hypothetical protein GFS60_01775 [Rhodococcus sp. WAY2]